MLNKKLIKKLRNGEICIDAKKFKTKKLKKVLGITPAFKNRYYWFSDSGSLWSSYKTHENLKPVKLKKFFK